MCLIGLSLSLAQFDDVSVTIDLRNIRENYHNTFEELRNDIKDYYQSTAFSIDDIDLGIPLNIHIVAESVSTKNNQQVLGAQFFISNKVDLNQYSKSSEFPFSKGSAIKFDKASDALSSILDFYAYIFLANDLDSYSSLAGDIFYSKAEVIANYSKQADYSKGWNERWKKINKIMENVYLRTAKYHYSQALYFYPSDDSDLKDHKKKHFGDFAEQVRLSDKFYGNDRNIWLFIDIVSQELAQNLGVLSMFDELILLSRLDPNNRDIYLKYLSKN